MAKKYIDAEATIETFKLWFERIGTKPSLDDVKIIISQVPAADVAPVRHGRWVLIRPGEWTATLKCSECGRHITVDPRQGDLAKDYPYCHCGAKMSTPAD